MAQQAGSTPSRDRDPAGRARNARPRDALGRPLPYGSPGVARLEEGVTREPQETLEQAAALLEKNMPFHAHEVFEDAWKSAPQEWRGLWKGLAQLAVGVTHAARGNVTGSARLLTRAADHMDQFRGDQPFDIDVDGLCDWALRTSADLQRRTSDGPTWLAVPPITINRGASR